MRPIWTITASAVCISLIVGAGIWWRYKLTKAHELKLAEEARIFQMSAQQGNAQAMAKLGLMYFNGQGVPQNDAGAVALLRKAAEKGDTSGQEGLALMYSKGRGVPQDYSEAVRWYRKAADQGSANGENGLALMYSEGRGVTQDYSEAVRWYRKAVDQGLAKAQYNLGNMYFYGRGVPQDRAEAIRWYRKAADQGDRYAQNALSPELSIFGNFALLMQFCAGIWLSLDFLSLGSPSPRKSLRSFRQKVITLTGVLGSFTAWMSWYGHTHYQIRYSNSTFAVFTLLKWMLYASLVALLVYIVRSGKKPGGWWPGLGRID